MVYIDQTRCSNVTLGGVFPKVGHSKLLEVDNLERLDPKLWKVWRGLRRLLVRGFEKFHLKLWKLG